MAKFRLAVLECDVPYPGVFERRGTYADMFRELLADSMRRVPQQDTDSKHDREQNGTTTTTTTTKELEVTAWNVVHKTHTTEHTHHRVFPDPDDFDGLLISGSRHTAFSDDAWILALVDYLSALLRLPSKHKPKPVVGICFGHQIIARALGGRVAINPDGWENSVTSINLSETGRRIFGVSSISMYQTHRDAVVQLPPGVDNIGSSDRCTVHGMYASGSPGRCRILSFQGHPEFDAETMALILKGRYAIGIASQATYDDAMTRLRLPHSGRLLARKICEFFLDEWRP